MKTSNSSLQSVLQKKEQKCSIARKNILWHACIFFAIYQQQYDEWRHKTLLAT